MKITRPTRLFPAPDESNFEADQENDFALDEKKLKEAFNSKTRGLVLNSPLNPTGKVFIKSELELIAHLRRLRRRLFH